MIWHIKELFGVPELHVPFNARTIKLKFYKQSEIVSYFVNMYLLINIFELVNCG